MVVPRTSGDAAAASGEEPKEPETIRYTAPVSVPGLRDRLVAGGRPRQIGGMVVVDFGWHVASCTRLATRLVRVILSTDGRPDLLEAARVYFRAEREWLEHIAAVAQGVRPSGLVYRPSLGSQPDALELLWPSGLSAEALSVRQEMDRRDGTYRALSGLCRADFEAVALATDAVRATSSLHHAAGWRYSPSGIEALLALANSRQLPSPSGPGNASGHPGEFLD